MARFERDVLEQALSAQVTFSASDAGMVRVLVSDPFLGVHVVADLGAKSCAVGIFPHLDANGAGYDVP
jgi:hypothetical protein